MKKNDSFFYLAIAALGFAIYKMVGKTGTGLPSGNPNTGGGTNTGGTNTGSGANTGGGTAPSGAKATINATEAQAIAKKIQDSIGYLTCSWRDISTAMTKLKNDNDVVMLYNAFGNWDGPATINGDLFNALNNAYYYHLAILDAPALKTIRQYAYTYGKYFQFGK